MAKLTVLDIRHAEGTCRLSNGAIGDETLLPTISSKLNGSPARGVYRGSILLLF